jgi:assimilatory nitrate reductase catalytic subunit
VHVAEPFVEVHPSDAAALGLEQGGVARVETAYGRAVLRVMISQTQRPGSLFVPIHWSAENSSLARAGALVHPRTDPLSGQPDAKATPARVVPLQASAFGFIMARQRVTPAGTLYWSRAPFTTGEVVHFALAGTVDMDAWSQAQLPGGTRISVSDPASGVFRTAVLDRGRLQGVVYAAGSPVLPSTQWLATMFARDDIAANEHRSLLAGRPIAGAADEGRTVCVCFGVGENRIRAAIRAGAGSADAVGRATCAGTNCGSCVPEIRRLVSECGPVPAAAE